MAPAMQITLRIEEDADSAPCPWPAVEKVVGQWMAGHAPLPPEWPLPQQRQVEIVLAVQTVDLLTAVKKLHDLLYDLRVNFTVSVD